MDKVPDSQAPLILKRRFAGAPRRSRSAARQRGGSALELALLLPWYIFLFVGAFDWGFYAHALISAESAVRLAAIYTSTSSLTQGDSNTACTLVLTEMKISANLNGVTGCSALPLIVTAGPVTGPDSQPASQVSVTYQTLNLIPIPGLLTSQVTITRTATMRLRG
jgi:Flp pilus assembly protein TadG